MVFEAVLLLLLMVNSQVLEETLNLILIEFVMHLQQSQVHVILNSHQQLQALALDMLQAVTQLLSVNSDLIFNSAGLEKICLNREQL